MDHNEKLANHKVVAYHWNDNGKLDRTVYEYQSAEDVENLKSKHRHHDLRVYNYLGQLVHEHQNNPSVNTYA